MSKKIVFILSALLVLPLFVSAQEIYFFRGEGCPHCAKMEEFLGELQQEYPRLKIYDYEIWYNEENRQLAEQIARERGIVIEAVPTLFIGDEVIVGNRQEQVRQAVEELLTQKAEKKVQAAAINTYGAWALAALMVIGLIWAVLSIRKPKHEIGFIEKKLPESEQ